MLRPLHRSLVAAVVLLAPVAGAHDGHRSQSIHTHDLSAAFRAAAEEQRLVLAYVSDRPGKGMPIFRWPDPEKVLRADALVREAVIAELDREADVDVLASLEMSAPAWVLYDEAGGRLWQHQGDLDLERLLAETGCWLTGAGAEARARANVARRGEEDVFARERLAGALAGGADPDLAVAEYAWCVERGIEGASLDAVARRPIALHHLAGLARRTSTGYAELERLRTRMEMLLRRDQDGDPTLARDVAILNRALGEEHRTLQLFHSLAPENWGRRGLFDAVFEELVAGGHYADVAALVPPLEAFRGEVQVTRRTLVSRPGLARAGEGRGTVAFTVRRGAELAEVLAGLGREEAQVLAAEVLAFAAAHQGPEGRSATRTLVERHLARSGNPAVLQQLRALDPAQEAAR